MPCNQARPRHAAGWRLANGINMKLLVTRTAVAVALLFVGGSTGFAQESHRKVTMTAPQPADNSAAILGLLKGTFETPDSPLRVEPIVVVGTYAIAGWSLSGMGGRALLRKTASGWAVHLCSGDGLKDAAKLVKIGIPAADAEELAADLAKAENGLDPALLAQFSSFDGTMMIDPSLMKS